MIPGLQLALALALPTATAMPGACGTPALLPTMPPPRPITLPARALEDRLTRDLYGVPNARESEHFVLRWGNQRSVQSADVDTMLDALEQSWSVEVDAMGHPAPETTEAYKLNVYIGDTGDGAPDSYGAAGYYYPDGEGYPMIVLAPSVVADPSFGVLTVAHEFYHAIQWSTYQYDYGDGAVGAWYWEATASWIEVEVYPGYPEYAGFLFGYALLPQLPVDFFDYPDTGALQEYHQYGAFIFPQYLSEFEGGREILRNTWVEPQTDSRDPLQNIDAELRARGSDLPAAFTAFAARNATWDYADGDVFDAYVQGYGEYYPAYDFGVAARESLSPDGDLGWRGVEPGLLPQRYGYNLVEVQLEAGVEAVRVEMQADDTGSEGSPAGWGLTVVAEGAGAPSYHPVSLDASGEGSVELAVEPEATLWLVAAAWSDARRDGETFAWQYRVAESDGGGGDGADGGDGGDGGSGTDGADGGSGTDGADGGSGTDGADGVVSGDEERGKVSSCASRSGSPSGLLALSGAALWVRRRKGRRTGA